MGVPFKYFEKEKKSSLKKWTKKGICYEVFYNLRLSLSDRSISSDDTKGGFS